jgi:hypothetical protein
MRPKSPLRGEGPAREGCSGGVWCYPRSCGLGERLCRVKAIFRVSIDTPRRTKDTHSKCGIPRVTVA